MWSDSVTFVSDIPGKNAGRSGIGGGGASTDELIRLVKGAQKSVTIESPYLVTTPLSQGLFREAIARGVRVRILTNSLASTDNLEAFSGYQRERDALLTIGVDIYEFKPDAQVRRQVMTGALQATLDYAPTFGLHAKSMVVDDHIAVIGTFNLDPRSANLNTECFAVIRNARDRASSPTCHGRRYATRKCVAYERRFQSRRRRQRWKAHQGLVQAGGAESGVIIESTARS